jgi:hypothetical protein
MAMERNGVIFMSDEEGHAFGIDPKTPPPVQNAGAIDPGEFDVAMREPGASGGSDATASSGADACEWRASVPGAGESGNHAAEGIRHNGGLGPLSEIEGLDGAKPAAASPSENLGAGQSYGDGLRSEGPGGGTGGRGGGAGPAGAGRGPGVLHGDDARRGVLPGALVTRGHPPSTRASPHRQQRACPVRQPRRGHWQRYKFKGRDDASGVVPWQKLNTTEETQAWRGQVIENQTSIINDKRGGYTAGVMSDEQVVGQRS